MQGHFGGQINYPESSEYAGPDKGAKAKNIIKKPCSIGAKQSCLVVDCIFAAVHMIETGVGSAVAEKPDKKQESAKKKEKSEDLPGEFSYIRNYLLLLIKRFGIQS